MGYEQERAIEQPGFYAVIPEFNSAGRLCNYHTGNDGETVKVAADDWEHFNMTAGRQYRVADGFAIFDKTLAIAMPDDAEQAEG